MRRREIYDIVFVVGFTIAGTASILAGVWCLSRDDTIGALILGGLGICLYIVAGIVGADS